jgi:hypothetical protein
MAVDSNLSRGLERLRTPLTLIMASQRCSTPRLRTGVSHDVGLPLVPPPHTGQARSQHSQVTSSELT